MTTCHPTINLSTRRRVVQDDDEEEEMILNEVRMYLNKNSGNYYVCIYIIDIQNTDYNIMQVRYLSTTYATAPFKSLNDDAV